MSIFISEEIEDLLRPYKINPFGEKKDKRVKDWMTLLNELPVCKNREVSLRNEVGVDFEDKDSHTIKNVLSKFLPWRKGPFRINDVFIDSEWDSSKKWQRFQSLNLDLKNKIVLDVGSGNGYYAFRMIGEGVDKVLCLEPNLVHVSQFHSINHFIRSANIKMLPERLEESGLKSTKFDYIFSMGLLYHQRNPEGHLYDLKGLLREKGRLVLETIIAPREFGRFLQPENGKYASMPNVHFIHTELGCKKVFEELGLKVIGETDLATTDLEEQRMTDWMPFKSFESALNKQDKSLTIEGYPSPSRKFYILEKN